MATDINMSLDDIIKKNKSIRNLNPRRKQGQNIRYGRNSISGRTGGNKVGVRPRLQNNRSPRAPVRYTSYKRGDVDSPWSHDLYEGNFGSTRIDYDAGGTKVIISNLDFGVTDTDLEELFMETGPLISCEIHYDKSGRSLGSGSVVFEKRTDAHRAINQYNGVPLDGDNIVGLLANSSSRPMKIEIAASAPGRLIGSRRLGTVRNRSSGAGPIGGRRRQFGGVMRDNGSKFGNRNRRNNGNISAEQLDAELDEYRKGM